jgi:hypothetical protein
MNLTTFYAQHGKAGLNGLAEQTGYSADYLWLCASIDEKTGKPRKPMNDKLAKALVATKHGFTAEALLPELFAAKPRRRRAAAPAPIAAPP